MAAKDITLDLWSMAQRGNLTDEELESLASSTEEGEFATRLADVVTGIGCLVASDSTEKTGSGNFQDGDVAVLLFTISECLESISARERIASDASYMLMTRYKNARIERQAAKQ